MTPEDTRRRNRIAGVLLGTAAGDALGAPYEFGPPLPPDTAVTMSGGGPWSPGEWTDDTAMAVALAEALADGGDPHSSAVQDRLVSRWVEWSHGAKDVGIQTRSVLATVDPAAPAASAREAARALHARTGRSGGNGSLMRTAPLALGFLGDGDEPALVAAAAELSTLTHLDPETGEACALWCLAIRHAVLTADLDVRVGLAYLPRDRAATWRARIEAAERSTPADFPNNGWVVEAFQAAWSAVHATAVPASDPVAGSFASDHLRLAVEAAVRGGNDADTVAAIAGGLLGAAWGASAVPWDWRRRLHGWPGLTAGDLVSLAERVATGGAATPFDGRYAERVGVLGRHPDDDGVWLGGAAGLENLPPDVDAVVSLCRTVPLPGPVVTVESRLVDRPGHTADVGFVLADAVRAVEGLRAEGRTVYLHCVAAHSRTPTVAALYGMRRTGSDAADALSRVEAVLPWADPNPELRGALAACGRD